MNKVYKQFILLLKKYVEVNCLKIKCYDCPFYNREIVILGEKITLCALFDELSRQMGMYTLEPDKKA